MNSVIRRATVPAVPPAEVYRPFLVPPPAVASPCGDPVGVQEIAERLGLESRSVHMIGRRGQLPEPDFTTNGFRAWEWAKILWWAGETERLRNDDLRRQYIDMFGHTPLDRSNTILPGGRKRVPGGILTRVDARPSIPTVPSKGSKAKPATKARAKAKAR